MNFANVSVTGQRIIIALLLTMFSLQAAQGSFCSELTATPAAQIDAPTTMPCHGDDESDSDQQCCLACVSMAIVTDISLATAAMNESNVADAIHFDLASRLERLYRPPNYDLS